MFNKPSGLPVHATVDNTQENVLNLLSQFKQKSMYITHRLDIATAGLLVIAKTKVFSREFNQLLQANQVKKMYRALVHGIYSGESDLLHYMEPSPKSPKTLSSEERRGWQRCQLKVHDTHEAFSNHTEVVVELLTGRTHQIRAQLSFEGYPIVGDRLYGSSVLLREDGFEEIALQSHFLSFIEPHCVGRDREEKYFKLADSPWSQKKLSTIER